MKAVVLSLLAATSACVPSRTAVFGPVDREINRRLNLDATWSSDERVPAAISELLEHPLDRDAAVKIALAKNRRLQAQYDELGIAASELAAATVLAPMTVDIEYKFAKGDEASEVELDVIQDVLDLLQIPQRRGIANAALAAARARAVAATVELVSRVESSYIDAVAAQQELELRQTVFDAASASAEVAERMYVAGNLPAIGIARERDQREQARIELARAQLDIEVTREAFNEVLGLTGKDTGWTITAQLAALPAAPPALDDLERNAIVASLDLAATTADAEAAAGRIGLARVRSLLPELGVGIAAERKDGEWDIGPAISFGLPVFNQGQGPRARANAELRRARNLGAATAIEVRARARVTRQRVLATYAEARHLYDVVLPLRQRIVDEALKQYNAMNASTFELLTARRDLVEAGRQYIDALRRFWRAAAEARAITRGAMPMMNPNEPARTSGSATAGGGH